MEEEITPMMPRKPLTPKQDAVLKTFVRYTKKHHFQPSWEEMRQLTGNQSVYKIITQIIKAGWLHRTGNPRAMHIPDSVWEDV